MNVQVPEVADVVNSLPDSWKSIVGPGPPKQWLDQFWATFAFLKWQKVPEAFDCVYLVRMVGGDLYRPGPLFALHPDHLTPLQINNQPQHPTASSSRHTVAGILTAVGCLCISDPRAKISTIPSEREPITAALAAAARRKSMPLQQLISLKNLGPTNFQGMCDILPQLKMNKGGQHARDVLRQCTVFEDTRGTPIALNKW